MILHNLTVTRSRFSTAFNFKKCSQIVLTNFYSKTVKHPQALCRCRQMLKPTLGVNLRTDFIKVPIRWNSDGSGNTESRRQKLLLATYVSFGIGGILVLAILGREFNKARLRFRGIVQVDDSAWRRVKLYKYKDVSIPGHVVTILDNIENFKVREDDIWVVSYPRSGTTWTQEIVYLIKSGLNFEAANSQIIDDRFPFLEFMYPGIQNVESMSSPRLIKTHLPLGLLPKEIHEKKPKIIYVCRNPKDIVVSYYYFTRMMKPITRFQGSFDDFFKLFMQDKVPYSPWWKHVLEFWQKKDEENVLFLKYEDLKKDLEGSIRRIAEFLDKPLSDLDVKKIAYHCQFENMKKNDSTNFSWGTKLGILDLTESQFMRKGEVGDWRSHFNQDTNEQINKMISFRFHNSGLHFDYDIKSPALDSSPSEVQTLF
ncbi:hypothetical protein ACJMK2_028959 [Sinanodonta woodiana]|uniref:Sulfotransferase domain-containing protein n=1 Tax=Sinanodonta woodiana TaxID=1069815 RepID=A0ABD3X949_SINWO